MNQDNQNLNFLTQTFVSDTDKPVTFQPAFSLQTIVPVTVGGKLWI